MTIEEYIIKAYEYAIKFEPICAMWYVDPMWEINMRRDNIKCDEIVDARYVIQKECDRRNMTVSRIGYVVDWIYDLITKKIDIPTDQLSDETINKLIETFKEKFDKSAE